MTPTEIEAAPIEVPIEAPVEKRGLGRLLLGIVLWPRSTFAYLREHGGRSWLAPLLLVAGLAVAARAVAVPIEMAQADAAQAALQAQLDAQGQGATGKGTFFISSGGPGGLSALPGTTGAAASPLLTYGLPAAGVVGDWLLRGVALLGLAWLLGGRPGAGAMFRMSGWTLIPTAARLIVALVVMLVAHHEPVTGLQGFSADPAKTAITINSDDTAPVAGNLVIQGTPGGKGTFGGIEFLPLLQSSFLSALDLYTLWSLVLMLIGVAVTARLGWLRALISTIAYWAVSLVLATLPPLLSFMLLTLARPGSIVGP